MPGTPRHRLVRVVSFALAFVVAATAARAQYPIARVSVDSAGVEGNGDSMFQNIFHRSTPVISGDDRFVAFSSVATNLVTGDTRNASDIFVHDRIGGATVRVSVDSSGIEGGRASDAPAISGDGRFVAFESYAGNLVAGDTNGVLDVFLHDRDPDGNGVFDEGNGVTTRVSVDSSGVEGNGDSGRPSISSDGTKIVFQSRANNLVAADGNHATDVFLRDVTAGVTTRLSVDSSGVEGNNDSGIPSISADGKFVAFESFADNLVPGDANHSIDVFVCDLAAKTTVLASVDSSGAQGNTSSFGPAPLSKDGSVVAFMSFATNLVAGDTNGRADVFVHDFTTGTTTRVSIDSNGGQYDDLYSDSPALSSDGSLVAFQRYAFHVYGELGVYEDFDILVHDRVSGATTPMSFNCGGVPASEDSFSPTVSADGQLVAFTSLASDLVSNDRNGKYDVFVHDRSVIEPDAAWTNYGSGFPGTLGTPSLTAVANPVLGTSIDVDVNDSLGSATVGFLLVGWNSASTATKYGGTILVDPAWAKSVAIPRAGRSFPIALPLDPAFCGVSLFAQMVEVDSGAAHGLSFTPGLQLTFGK